MAPLSLGSDVCPICRAPSPALAFVKNGYPLHRCGYLRGGALRHVRRAGENLEALYSSEYFTEGGAGYPDYLADERTHRRQARRLSAKDPEARHCARIGSRRRMRRGLLPRRSEKTRLERQRLRAQRVRAAARRARSRTRRRAIELSRPELLARHGIVRCGDHVQRARAPARSREGREQAFRYGLSGGYLVIETWDPHSLLRAAARIAMAHLCAPDGALLLHAARPGATFPRGRWSLVSYRPSTKWISAGTGSRCSNTRCCELRWRRFFAPSPILDGSRRLAVFPGRSGPGGVSAYLVTGARMRAPRRRSRG